MFDAKEIKELPEWLARIFSQFEADVLLDIVRRLSQAKEITRSADWQLYRLTQLRTFDTDYKKLIQELISMSDKGMEKMFKDLLEKSYARDEKLYSAAGIPFVPIEENEDLQQILEAVTRQTKENIENITGTFAIAKQPAGSISPTEYMRSKLDKATVEISTGVFDYNAAIKKVITELKNSGLRSVSFESGHRDSIDVAARRAVMTGLSQLTGKVSEMNAEKLGTDFFEVSAHVTARPSHALWQGKVYSRAELETVCGLGTGPGLCGWNCYHHYDPFFPGISKRKWTDEELQEIYENCQKKHEYGGKSYTMYEATQVQRSMERRMRRMDLQIKMQKKAGLEDDYIATKAMRQRTYEEYRKFSKAMDLPEDMQRVFYTTDSEKK